VVDGGLVAVGSEAGSTTVVWSSTDGRVWTDAGRLDYTPMAAAASGDTFVIIAADQSGGASGYYLHRGTLGAAD
jgi:hypothetical protein